MMRNIPEMILISSGSLGKDYDYDDLFIRGYDDDSTLTSEEFCEYKYICRNSLRKITSQNGMVKYRWNDELHRSDGPAVIHPNGDQEWYDDGQRHRVDGPAIEKSTCKIWYNRGKRHRTDGPAVIHVDGRVEYWLNGKCLSEQQFQVKTLMES